MRDQGQDRDEFTLGRAMEFAQELAKALILVNGGAAVAILAFYGDAGTAGFRITDDMADALSVFGWSIIAVFLMHLFGFFSLLLQGSNYNTAKWERVGDVASYPLTWAAVIASFASIGLFGYGLHEAAGALTAEAHRAQVSVTAAPAAYAPAVCCG